MRSLVIFAVLSFSAPGAGRAEIIDGVAAVLGKQVVTESEVDKEARLEAYFNGHPPASATAASRRETLERLIDQRLIQRTMDQIKFPSADDAQARKRLEAMGPVAAKPSDYGLRDQDLLNYARRIEDIDRFLKLRFNLSGPDRKDDPEIDHWLKEVRARLGVRVTEPEKP